MPRVSVIIPAYNAEAYLVEAIESVLAQDYRDFEIIVIDDGSTDRTAHIAASYRAPVRYIRQENRGLAEARNRGIREAAGDFLAFLDADDRWASGKLTAQMALFERHPTSVCCFTRTRYVDAGGRVLRTSNVPVYQDDLVEVLLLHSCVIGPPSAAVIRRRALERTGLFDPDFSQCADWDMWLRLAECGGIIYANEILVDYRVHGSNMSRNIPLLEKDTFGVLAKFFATPQAVRYARQRRRIYSNHWMILAGSYLAAGQLGASARCLAAGLLLYPRNVTRPLGYPARWLGRRLPFKRAAIPGTFAESIVGKATHAP